jgi:tetratricopeptide (TPR) repeat protein
MDKDQKEKRKQSEEIWDLIKKDKYEDARLLLNIMNEEEPESHWVLSRIALTYYEEKNYEKALEFEYQALELAPDCPLVLWGYAGVLDMLEYDDEAIQVYRKLIHRGVTRIANGICGEGLRKARSLVNDCRYRLAQLYAGKGQFQQARKYIREYISNRNPNCTSIYNLKEAKKRQALIYQAENPGPGSSGISKQLLPEKVAALKARKKLTESIYQTINRLYKENKDPEAREIIFKWLEKHPQDHRVLYRLSESYTFERDFSQALEYLEQSLKIEPDCPSALSEYSYVLYMLHRDAEAIQVCKGLLKRGVRRLAFYRDCLPGLRKAKGFINDCRYTLGLIYGSSGEFSLAKKYIQTHIAHRGPNCPSSYQLNYVKKSLIEVMKCREPNPLFR